MFPLEDEGYVLNKDKFRDTMRLRYDLPLDGLPYRCTCLQVFDMAYAMTCELQKQGLAKLDFTRLEMDC